MEKQFRVFISSTQRDLLAYRQAITSVILRLGMFPIDMATFNPTNRNALQLCYDKVQAAHVFVGIYAHRYGYVPSHDITYITTEGRTMNGDNETSITHMEYLWAKAKNLPLLLFTIDDIDTDGNPILWPPMHIDDEAGKTRLNNLKNIIKSQHVVGFFHSPDHLATQVVTGLVEVLNTIEETKREKVDDKFLELISSLQRYPAKNSIKMLRKNMQINLGEIND